VAECAAWILGFVGFGLAWAALEARSAGASGYDAPMHEESAEAERPPRVWLVDGYNVLHAGVLQGRDRRDWWKAAAQARLVALADSFDDRNAEIWVVFDRKGDVEASSLPEPPPGSRLRLVYASSADDWLVRRVRRAEDAESFAVVTADRQVQGRARHAGARVVSPLAFLARCDRALRGAPGGAGGTPATG
jgi:predicted RNA-binding protein with PIN domain